MRLKSFSKALLLAAALASTGCLRIPAHVEKGEEYATGDKKYDAFFKEVRDLRAEALRAEDDEVRARADLIAALGLDSKTDLTPAVTEARSRAKKLRDYGVMMHLDLTPDVRLTMVKGHGASADPPVDLSKAIEGSTRASLDLTRRLVDLSVRAGELEKQRTALRGDAPSVFRGLPQVRRDEITHELDASADVLSQAVETSRVHAGRASEFVVELTQAMETGAALAAATPPTPAVAASKGGASKPVAKPVSKGGGTTKPAAAPVRPVAPPPPKKPKPSDDFEP